MATLPPTWFYDYARERCLHGRIAPFLSPAGNGYAVCAGLLHIRKGKQVNNELLTRDEVLAFLKCSRSCLYVLMESRGFPRPIKLGAANRWLRSEVESWVEHKATDRANRGIPEFPHV